MTVSLGERIFSTQYLQGLTIWITDKHSQVKHVDRGWAHNFAAAVDTHPMSNNQHILNNCDDFLCLFNEFNASEILDCPILQQDLVLFA